MDLIAQGINYIFQSTLPVRGATASILTVGKNSRISIHAPREGSDLIDCIVQCGELISIHAPREGSDYYATGICKSLLYFNPRSP